MTQVIVVPEGESGLAQNLSEDQVEEIASLYVALHKGGELADHYKKQICGPLRISRMTLERALRSPRVLKAIKLQTQALATLALPGLAKAAEKDALHGEARIRAGAREFLAKQAQGDPTLVTVQNVQTWDPSRDEELWERGAEFFKGAAEQIADRVKDKMLGDASG